MSESLQHLVLVRHGVSEGDERRAAWRRGEVVHTTKMPEDEELTARGEQEAPIIGQWIIKNILQRYNIGSFDGYFVSTTPRSLQTAIAMGLDKAIWQADHRLDERNRGRVRGLHPRQHQQMYPESFAQMKSDPLHWIPPGGEAIIPHLADQFSSFYDDIKDMETVIVVGHRDNFWAAMSRLEGLSEAEMVKVNTDEIVNNYIMHYTSVSPETRQQSSTPTWKYYIDPMRPETATGWQALPNIAPQPI